MQFANFTVPLDKTKNLDSYSFISASKEKQ